MLDYPVISVDMCKIKNLEGMLGTGEAFIRAFKEIAHENITGKSFMVFGYGKVGRGIAHYLKKEGAQITVVDLNPVFLQQAKLAGFTVLLAQEATLIEKAVEKMFCVVTATGKENVISKNYNAEPFKNKYLANMGVDDEFGYKFKNGDVLCNKRPINFYISVPTLFRYLDPVFYAHNLGIDILRYADLKNGLYPFPSFLAEEVIQRWEEIYKENINF